MIAAKDGQPSEEIQQINDLKQIYDADTIQKLRSRVGQSQSLQYVEKCLVEVNNLLKTLQPLPSAYEKIPSYLNKIPGNHAPMDNDIPFNSTRSATDSLQPTHNNYKSNSFGLTEINNQPTNNSTIHEKNNLEAEDWDFSSLRSSSLKFHHPPRWRTTTKLQGHLGPVRSVAWEDFNEYCIRTATAGDDGLVNLWSQPVQNGLVV